MHDRTGLLVTIPAENKSSRKPPNKKRVARPGITHLGKINVRRFRSLACSLQHNFSGGVALVGATAHVSEYVSYGKVVGVVFPRVSVELELVSQSYPWKGGMF